MPIAREQFEEMTADLLERTAYTSRQLLAAAELAVEGRQPRPPRRRLHAHADGRPHVAEAHRDRARPDGQPGRGRRPRRGAVCRPLAGQARRRRGGGFKVTNVNAHSLGIEGIEQDTLRKTNVILIPRNTALPAKRTERFVTKSEGQHRSSSRCWRAKARLPGECTAIGRTVVRDLPAGLPKGLAGRSHLRVRFQRAAERAGGGAGDAP